MSFQTKTTAWERLRSLRESLERNGFVRLLEAHNGLSGIVGETAHLEKDGKVTEYDGLWVSSLTESASKGLPDASLVSFDTRLLTIDEILNVTSKPLVVDGDTGGEPSQFEYFVRHLERRGVSAVIIEDKVFPKRNSLDASSLQTLEDPAIFAGKIQAGKDALATPDFKIIARLESLIAGTGMDDALARAEKYILAGADGIMIHSSKRQPNEILAFAAEYGRLCRRLGKSPMLVCVPTTYNSILESDLMAQGFQMAIYANHLLRASYKAMKQVAHEILQNGRSLEVDPLCAPVAEIFSTVGLDRIAEMDRKRSPLHGLSVIIPAAGRDPAFPDAPKSLLRVAGRSVMDFQLQAIRRTGLNRVVVIRGHEGDQLAARYAEEPIIFCENSRHAETFDLYSIFQAEKHMENGFVLIYSDILFSDQILCSLVAANQDIVLAVDSSYQYHKHEIHKELDLAISKEKREPQRRSLRPNGLREIARIGKSIAVHEADFEFIGMAFFSKRGAAILRQRYENRRREVAGAFHDAASFEKASITDLLQDLIEQGVAIHGLEIFKGWLEIHNRYDIAVAEREIVPFLSIPANDGGFRVAQDAAEAIAQTRA